MGSEVSTMIICVIFDLGMAVIMFLFGISFVKSNGKAAAFLSGYNMKSTEAVSYTHLVEYNCLSESRIRDPSCSFVI